MPSNGKIAMVLDEIDTLISVKVCTTESHVLISTKLGKSIRFPVNNIRQFKGRISDGVRAIRLSSVEDQVISMSILTAMDVSSDTKDLYLRVPLEKRLLVKEDRFINQGVASILTDLGLSTDIFMTMVQNEEFI